MSVALLQSVYDRIDCMRIRPLVLSLVDDQLDAMQRRRLIVHLEACRRCGLDASTYLSIKGCLNSRALPPDPEAVARLEAFAEQVAGRSARSGTPEL